MYADSGLPVAVFHHAHPKGFGAVAREVQNALVRVDLAAGEYLLYAVDIPKHRLARVAILRCIRPSAKHRAVVGHGLHRARVPVAERAHELVVFPHHRRHHSAGRVDGTAYVAAVGADAHGTAARADAGERVVGVLEVMPLSVNPISGSLDRRAVARSLRVEECSNYDTVV